MTNKITVGYNTMVTSVTNKELKLKKNGVCKFQIIRCNIDNFDFRFWLINQKVIKIL